MTRPDPLSRRHALRGAAVVGVGVPILAACGGSDGEATDPAEADSGSQGESSQGRSKNGRSKKGSKSGGDPLASTGDIPEGSGLVFESAGVVVTQPTAGEFKAFDSICTHQGCPVAEVVDTINCYCHGSKFSISDGSVVNGPATAALAAKEIAVDGDSITLA